MYNNRMSSRPRGRGGRGGGPRGGYGGYRGRGGGHYRGRNDYSGGNRQPPSHREPDPEKLLASLGPEAQLALTSAIIKSVLKSDNREGGGRSGYRDGREGNYRHHQRDLRQEIRGGHYREEARERRHYTEDRRYDARPYHEEGRGSHYDREKGPSGPPRYRSGNKYLGPHKRRPSPLEHPGPSYKRQRMGKHEGGEGRGFRHREPEYMEEEMPPREHERSREREREHRSPYLEEHHGEPSADGATEGGEQTEEGDEAKSQAGNNSGVQVTIGADGERAVNSEGHARPRVAGRLFIELRCPHCPNQRSITFKEYKYHLGTEAHKSQLKRLARKHSVVLRKIRVQQRQEQKDIEAKWREEQPEEFKTSVTRFCNTCKLAFKCMGSNTTEGISLHNRSKLHRMQRHYLHPRCGMCHITFPSRMVYEHHIATISHLRVRTHTIDNKQDESRLSNDENNQEEEGDDLDLTNFMTLDSVGEDDEEEVGSEHEEITGGLDAVEAAEKEAAVEDDDDDYEDGHARHSRSRSQGGWDKDHPDEDDEPLGMEFVNKIDAYFCSLCQQIIRADSSLGPLAIKRHCRSAAHVSQFKEQHLMSQTEDVLSGDEKEDEGHGESVHEGDPELEDPDQDKLWEEVDKGLTALQGEIMTEIEGEDIPEEANNEEHEVEEKNQEDNQAEVGTDENVDAEVDAEEENVEQEKAEADAEQEVVEEEEEEDDEEDEVEDEEVEEEEEEEEDEDDENETEVDRKEGAGKQKKECAAEANTGKEDWDEVGDDFSG